MFRGAPLNQSRAGREAGGLHELSRGDLAAVGRFHAQDLEAAVGADDAKPCVAHFDDLLGTTDAIRTWTAPATYLAVAVTGACWACRLKRTRPDVYAAIGHGDRSDVTSSQPSAIPARRRRDARPAEGHRFPVNR